MPPKHTADLAIVVGDHHAPMGDDDHADEPEMDHEEHASSMADAADEVFDAIKKGDKNAFRDALEAYCDLHQTKPDEPSDADMGGEDDGDEDEDEHGIHY
jgi:hypothetical protein